MRNKIGLALQIGSLVSAAFLAGCGGGGSSSGADSNTQGTSPPLNGGNPSANTDPWPKCPRAKVEDAWAFNRFECTSVGANAISLSKSGVASTDSYEYTLVERIHLNTGPSTDLKYMAYFVCLKNSPSPTDQYFRIQFANDIESLFKLNNSSTAYIPAGVWTTTFLIQGETGKPQPWNKTTCDPAKHPLIIDFATGKVESINPNATLTEVYDSPN